jgi:hypothetical protein
MCESLIVKRELVQNVIFQERQNTVLYGNYWTKTNQINIRYQGLLCGHFLLKILKFGSGIRLLGAIMKSGLIPFLHSVTFSPTFFLFLPYPFRVQVCMIIILTS